MEGSSINNIVVNGRFVTQPLTGVQRYALEVTRRLPGSIWVIAPGPIAPEYKDLSEITRIDPLGKFVQNGPLGHLWEQVALPRWVTSEDLLWSPCGVGPLVTKNQVLTIHDIAYLEHPEWFNRKFVSWYRFLVPSLVRRVRRVIAVSEFTKARLVEVTKVSPKKITVIHNGVDVCFQPRSREEVKKVIKDLGIPSSDYVLTLGTLEPRKNLHRLLKAWGNIHNEMPSDVWLVVVGAKGKQLVFQDISFDMLPPKVYLTGYVPDDYLPALYSGAIAFAYVSVYEGFGLPPLEAMASGCPVIVSNVASLPEVCGDAALYCNPYDVNDIAEKMLRLAMDGKLRKELRDKGFERARQFSWEKAAKEHMKVFEEVLEGDEK